MLGALVCSLVLLLAYPITEYVDQQQHIDELEQQVAEKQQAVDDLTAQQKQLEDPAYVEQQARSRLKYVMPGDTVYIVVDEGADDPQAPAAGQSGDAADSESWYDTLAESVEAADGG